MYKICAFLIVIFSSTFSFSQVDTPKHPILTSKIFINIGLYSPLKTMRIGADGTSPNTIIDFNKSFKLDKRENTIALNFVWRFSKKWNFGTEYFYVKSSHGLNLEKEIKWEDVTYKVGTNINAGFGLRLYRIFFGRTISTGLKHELGGGLGIHAMDITSYIQGEAFIEDLNIGFEKKSVSAVAPFPNIGFWYFYTPSPKWAITARFDWFGAKIGEYSGSLWNIAPGVNYQAFKNIGIGVSYRYFKTSLKVDKTNWNGNLYFIFQGPLFTISTNF